MSYPNSLMELFLSVGILAFFGNFWTNFCLIHSRYWFYDHFFAWNLGIRIYFLCETQKYVEILKNTWMISFYKGILVISGNFWANICLVYSTRWLCGCIFPWNHGRQIFSFRIIENIVPVLKYDENVWRKLTKIVKFEVNLGFWGKFWTNWVLKK